ncbi:hypothetical protein F5Y16DRAFT_188132 [Xylariaceae sp. FL0255]|nr:hypothetical protein F5Y16DRAFT_188132 [Xylariaceae sp. FL0255]
MDEQTEDIITRELSSVYSQDREASTPRIHPVGPACPPAVPTSLQAATLATINSSRATLSTLEQGEGQPIEILRQPSDIPPESRISTTADSVPSCQDFFQLSSVNHIILNIVALIAGQECTVSHANCSKLKFDLRYLLNLAQMQDNCPECGSPACVEEIGLANDLIASSPVMDLNQNRQRPVPRIPWLRRRRKIRVGSCTLTITTKTSGIYSIRPHYGVVASDLIESHFNTQILVKPDDFAFSLLMEVQQKLVRDGSFTSFPRISVNNIVPEDSLVFEVARTGCVEDLKRLISEGKASLRDHDEDGRSLLHYSTNNPTICQFLVKNGLDVDAVAKYPQYADDYQITPLLNAMIHEHNPHTARILVTEGADPTITPGRWNNASVVMVACGLYTRDAEFMDILP